jgi:hypothetical protein
LQTLLDVCTLSGAGTVPSAGKGIAMTEQKSLWEYREEEPTVEEEKDRADRDKTRRRTIKKLRASGNWLLLLRVAHTIPQPFTLNDISIALWRTHPNIFGMKGHPYPDNHKVHYILYGTRGLIAQGLIRRVRQGLFCLPEGADLAQMDVAATEKCPADPTQGLSPTT